MKRRSLIRLALVLALASACAATAARGASADPHPVLVGFEDEPSFVWASNRIDEIATAGESGANVIRVIANWATIAPKRPSTATNPADPAYRFNWLDDLVWQAQHRGMRLLLTVWGTPPWASATHKLNAAPSPATLGAFCSALATRYSGHYQGLAPVTLYSVWNEPNLAQFLSPQYIGKRDASPRLYAGMFRACYGAIKRANPFAKVAAGDTSPRGVDHPRGTGIQQSHSPGRFAQLVAAQRPLIRFDAWAHHPYGGGFTGKATVPFHWPNVGVADLTRFESHLKSWFHRPSIPLWVTEFAYQTRPESPRALSYVQQASYLRQAFLETVNVPQVEMFLWYVFEDTPGQRWQSGLYRSDHTPKPALGTWERTIVPFSVDNPHLRVRKGVAPTITLPLVVLQNYRLPTDPKLGVAYHVFQNGQPIVGAETEVALARTGYATFKLSAFKPVDGRYTVQVAVNDIHGNVVNRTISMNTYTGKSTPKKKKTKK